ncbi:TlpA disulfide reductase family protein [uncultured Duncaniella sp.]|uniref:TlpA disulfide reductase family protein n=1 Tax=uncultured Duncaniella sp. TaxID=2768039 RepID=UPI0025B04CCE|nr:TlpA disulfide reductase family protein [uncultured Duncaniella sp.]
MRHVFTTSLLCSMLFASCSGEKSDVYTIRGEIEGLPDSTVVLIIPLAHTSEAPLAETTVIDGKFEFTGTTDEPIASLLTVKDHYGSKRFILENADIDMSGNVSASESGDGRILYNFNDVTVAGSPLTDEYIVKMAPRYRIDSIMVSNQSTYATLIEQLHKAMADRNQTAIDSIQSTDGFKKMSSTEKYCFTAFDSLFHAGVEENKNSFWGPILMISHVSYFSPKLREMYESFPEDVKNTYAGRLVAQELYPVGRPGDKMADFSQTDINGSEVTLASACNGKKYILLDFWASWCGPCRRELPNVKSIYEKHMNNGFDVLSISIDQDDSAWRQAVKEEDLKWINLRDTDHTIADAYHVSSVPTMYIVDSEGRLVAENLRGEELAAKVDELMAE